MIFPEDTQKTCLRSPDGLGCRRAGAAMKPKNGVRCGIRAQGRKNDYVQTDFSSGLGGPVLINLVPATTRLSIYIGRMTRVQNQAMFGGLRVTTRFRHQRGRKAQGED